MTSRWCIINAGMRDRVAIIRREVSPREKISGGAGISELLSKRDTMPRRGNFGQMRVHHAKLQSNFGMRLPSSTHFVERP